MILAKQAILDARKEGRILIEPFNVANVRNSSVDVTLGEWYWRETRPLLYPEQVYTPGLFFDEDTLNPYDKESVMQMWGKTPKRAIETREAMPGIPKGTKVIPIEPGENLLCHTVEFIGGTDLKLTTMMKARSSMGRSQITVCRCAGAGDIGYASRWTLEVTNNGKRTVPLVCGRRIAQLWFMETTGLLETRDSYNATGKYQHGSNRGKSLIELEAQWKPEDMLPKMWLDDEVIGNRTGIVVPTDEETFEHGYNPTQGWKIEIE